MKCVLCTDDNDHTVEGIKYRCNACGKISFYDNLSQDSILRAYAELRDKGEDTSEMEALAATADVNI